MFLVEFFLVCDAGFVVVVRMDFIFPLAVLELSVPIDKREELLFCHFEHWQGQIHEIRMRRLKAHCLESAGLKHPIAFFGRFKLADFYVVDGNPASVVRRPI